jgi:hypothetical protein
MKTTCSDDNLRFTIPPAPLSDVRLTHLAAFAQVETLDLASEHACVGPFATR